MHSGRVRPRVAALVSAPTSVPGAAPCVTQPSSARIASQDGTLLGDSSYVRRDGSVLSPRKLDYSGHPAIRGLRKSRSWQGVVARGSKLFLAVSYKAALGRRSPLILVAFLRLDTSVARQMKQALGTEVAFLQGDKIIASSLPKAPTSLRNALIPRELTVGGTDFYTAYAALPGTGPKDRMGLLTLQSQEDALSAYRNVYAALGLAAAVALCVSLLLGVGVSRTFSRPIEQVIAAAQELKKGSWPDPFKVKRRDEIGQLQTAFNDMTAALRKGTERLLALIDADPLTGLDNHRKFQERLEEEVTRTAFTKEPLSLLIVDIDKFQSYNELHGHAEGDSVLSRTARLLRQHCPDEAILARYGGEEFAVLLPNTELSEAEALAEKLRIAIQKGAMTRGEKLAYTVSLGCAQLADPKQLKGFALTAELAASRAKQLGRNRVCRFDAMPGVEAGSDPYQLHRFLQDGSFATIQALAAAVDAKDPYTQGHSQRVAEYARDLAAYMGYPRETVDLVFTAGTLHDVGKVGVPDDILKKPGKLTDEERAVMETHPVLGELIVRKAPHLADTLPGVRNHHERWDGAGYPDRIAGEEIPLLGRLLAVADMFDAMTSDRPYRKGLHLWEALWEVERQAGKQLDPDMAHAFVAMMRARSEWPVGA